MISPKALNTFFIICVIVFCGDCEAANQQKRFFLSPHSPRINWASVPGGHDESEWHVRWAFPKQKEQNRRQECRRHAVMVSVRPNRIKSHTLQRRAADCSRHEHIIRREAECMRNADSESVELRARDGRDQLQSIRKTVKRPF